MQDVILVLELKTLKTRAAAVDADLNVLDQESLEINRSFPQYGWMECSADEIWSSLLKCAQNVVRRVGLERFAGISILNERESLVVWERASGKAIGPVISWQDRRTEKKCQAMKNQRKEPMLHYRTGLFLDPAFSGTKIAWILENNPDARSKARQGELACGTLDSWALWNLTGQRLHATDHGNASRTQLYDLYTQHWEPQLLAAFDVPAAMLPHIQGTTGPFGECLPGFFGAALPILAVSTSQQAGLYIQNVPGTPTFRAHFGQQLSLQLHTGDECLVQTNLVTSIAWKLDEKANYFLEGPGLGCGTVLQWLRDGVGMLSDYDQAEGMAGSVPDTGGVYFVPAFSGLGAPYLDPTARAAILGLNARTSKSQIVRAALEGFAHQVVDIAALMEKGTRIPAKLLRADGELARNNFLMQFQANLLGMPVERPVFLDSALAGAALMAGRASGRWPERDLAEIWRMERVFEPTLMEADRKQLRYRWLDAVERSQGWEKVGVE
jgi:glycerol kinase